MVEQDEQRGDWIETYTGGRFYPISPSAGDVSIADIAHALSLTCRFGGHCKQFYSVAQHSVLVSKNCKYQLHGLLHDAEEAYMPDICRPLKRCLHMLGVKQLEHIAYWIEDAIATAFGIVWNQRIVEAVKMADNVLLATEGRDLMVPMQDGTEWWSKYGTPLVNKITPVDPHTAETMFLNRFMECTSHASIQEVQAD